MPRSGTLDVAANLAAAPALASLSVPTWEMTDA